MNDTNNRIGELLSKARGTPPLRTAAQIESMLRSSNGITAVTAFPFLSIPLGVATASISALLVAGAVVWVMSGNAPKHSDAPSHDASAPPSLSVPSNPSVSPSAVESKSLVAGTSAPSRTPEAMAVLPLHPVQSSVAPMIATDTSSREPVHHEID